MIKFRIPKKIDILGNEWKIEKHNDLIEHEGVLCYGLCIPKTRVIKIYIEKNDMGSTKESLLHEIGHAIKYELGINVTSMNSDLSEIIVEGFSRWIVKHLNFEFK